MMELVSVGRSGSRFRRSLRHRSHHGQSDGVLHDRSDAGFMAGMSAGAAMAVNLAVTHSDRYAAAGVHSGLAFGVADEAFSAMSAMRMGTGAAPIARRTRCDRHVPRGVAYCLPRRSG